MHKINVSKLLSQKYQKKMPISIGRRQSCQGLRPKIEVESKRLLNKKY